MAQEAALFTRVYSLEESNPVLGLVAGEMDARITSLAASVTKGITSKISLQFTRILVDARVLFLYAKCLAVIFYLFFFFTKGN